MTIHLAASIPIADLASANATLEAAGFGPGNFSVPAYTNRPDPTHAVCHAWGQNFDAFYDAVKALPNCEWSETEGTPEDRERAALDGISGVWGGDAADLTGVVSPGLHKDADGVLWWVIQQYDTSIWSDPTIIPALVRRARVPGEVAEWQQPLDQFDAYKLVNPFT